MPMKNEIELWIPDCWKAVRIANWLEVRGQKLAANELIVYEFMNQPVACSAQLEANS
jgi:hypothetical protein